jgi:diguanylate cyclase (GGDEF)-like protein/PAS domain S-box-containing protein
MENLSGNNYRDISNNVLAGCAVLKVVWKGDIPVDAIFMEISGVFEAIPGFNPEQLIGKRVSQIFPEIWAENPEFLTMVGRVASNRSGTNLEYYFHRFRLWFFISIFSNNNDIINIIFYDITENKKTSEQIKKLSEAALKYLEFPIAQIDYQMIADNLLALTGAKFTLIDTYNRASNSVTTQAVVGNKDDIEKAIRIVGNIVGRSWEIKNLETWISKTKRLTKVTGIHELIFEDSPTPKSIALENVLQIGDIYRFGICHAKELLGNVFILMPKGKDLTTEIIELYVSQLEAVLVRKKAEEELNNLTNQYATVINGSQDLMYLVKVCADEFRFDMVNKKCEERFQQRMEEIKGKTVSELFANDFGKILKAKFKHCIETKTPISYEEVYNFLGKTRIGHTVLSPVINDGKVVQIVGSTRDITEQKQAEDQIRYLSFYDDLTGLFNRAFFEEELTRLDIEKQYPISIILSDINGLKFVNNAFGRQEGDALLVSAAKIIEKSCREEDIVCRWGGDEFAILLPRCAHEDAEKICQRIKNAALNNGRSFIPISLALGIATKNEANYIQEVLREAEDRMNRNKLLDTKSSRSSILASLQKTLQERTHETEEHELRLQNLALKIGKTLGLSGSELDELVLLAALHDIGKVAVPDHILKKPGPLSSEEWIIMKSHSEIGYRIALACPELILISELILTHHERWDGTGYPRGLKKEEIPLLSRILSVIDAYDAMTNTRPYRKAIRAEEALIELRRNAGTQFDPELVEIFIETNNGRV